MDPHCCSNAGRRPRKDYLLLLVLMFKTHSAVSMNYWTLLLVQRHIISGPVGETVLITETFPVDFKLLLFKPYTLEIDSNALAFGKRTQAFSC
jgi:hypothetical protein